MSSGKIRYEKKIYATKLKVELIKICYAGCILNSIKGVIPWVILGPKFLINKGTELTNFQGRGQTFWLYHIFLIIPEVVRGRLFQLGEIV